MLVLTRKVNQSICLGENIKVTVLSVEGDRVSLGVEAPREVRVFRTELLEGTKVVNRESLISEFRTIQEMKEEP
ncbi:MAG: carbon storage regulator CsrA [Oscillospiraceae bacterium]|jgi:carbon storage regulator|nr:carbon storage regulator CsrA [Oscillospiraceae bacterium]